jgi:hypothetical protein
MIGARVSSGGGLRALAAKLDQVASGAFLAPAARTAAPLLEEKAKRDWARHVDTGAGLRTARVTARGKVIRIENVRYARFVRGLEQRRGVSIFRDLVAERMRAEFRKAVSA